ncbi:unnamed protein product [Linum trigynum]|uniref:Uncharacterized protein n=1 Tax=Linum trigynum TaxID=586398 RepID=A0AAV2ELR6_9ROSI
MNQSPSLFRPLSSFSVSTVPSVPTRRVSNVSGFRSDRRHYSCRSPLRTARCVNADVPVAAEAMTAAPSSPTGENRVIASKTKKGKGELEILEENIEKVVYRCRFLAILAVFGSLIGSFLCFIKGCVYVGTSFMQYFATRGKVIIYLVEAIDVYLLGTVMLVFGMGLYELFVSNLSPSKTSPGETMADRSNLFGMFTLKERPKWLEVKTVNELKTKLGHVIVMLLLIGFFEKSKTAAIHSPLDLLCFAASVLLCSGSLFLLSKLSDSKSGHFLA